LLAADIRRIAAEPAEWNRQQGKALWNRLRGA
jgi:hypothetical protein